MTLSYIKAHPTTDRQTASGRRAPHCQKCGLPMRGHTKGRCSERSELIREKKRTSLESLFLPKQTPTSPKPFTSNDPPSSDPVSSETTTLADNGIWEDIPESASYSEATHTKIEVHKNVSLPHTLSTSEECKERGRKTTMVKLNKTTPRPILTKAPSSSSSTPGTIVITIGGAFVMIYFFITGFVVGSLTTYVYFAYTGSGS